MLKSTDTMNDRTDLTTFIRTIGKSSTFIFNEGKLMLKKFYRKVLFIKPVLASMF